MTCKTCAVLSLALLCASPVFSQTPQTTEPAAPAPAATPAPSVWSAGPIDFSGLVDGYYSLNFGHPASKNNVLRNFDVKANQFSLNFAKLTMEHTADPVGFKLELAAGRGMDVFHATDPAGVEVVKHLLQAYVTLKPAKWRGLQFDFGKFVTSAGSELTETHLNWNYSRSLLFTNGPYYHFGARTAMPLGKYWTAGAQLVNGWNNVEDNNSPKTVGLTSTFTTSKFTWANNYYFGNEKTDTLGGVKIEAPGLRHFYDTVIGLNPNGRVSGLINFDYGVDRVPNGTDNKFYGVALNARVLATSIFAISPRYDWYKDAGGFITGKAQTLQEFTLTGDMRLKEGFLARLEYRRDWSNQPYFDRGNELASSKNQNTLLIGFIAYFGPKR
ncbi:MAG: porin [Bryobacteraceae bacterium]|nr:porin [Bryobacteraceae bacterium]